MAAKKKKKPMVTTMMPTLMPILPINAGSPDATTWVMRDLDGVMQRVKVTDMSDSHLFRWVQYFRRKFREREGDPAVETEVIDKAILTSMVTAPAIYAEIVKRGIGLLGPLPAALYKSSVAAAPDVAQETRPVAGVRLITLNDDD